MSDLYLSNILGKSVDFQDFAASGTWVHPEPGTFYQLYIEMYGGGGSGGGGGCSLNAGNASGAGGGGCASLHRLQIFATDSLPVVVGAGGAIRLGASTSTNGASAAGIAGNAGGYSSIDIYRAPGGNAGVGSASAASDPALYQNATLVTGSVLSSPIVNKGTTGTSMSGGNTAFGGAGGASWFSPPPNGGNGILSTDGFSLTGNPGQTPSSSHWGAGGGGGGGAVQNSIAHAPTVTGGSGGAGANGRVRVWAWRTGD